MRTTYQPNCMMCQVAGVQLYSSLNDRLFGVEGEWSFFSCLNSECGLIWLSPQPVVEDIADAYIHYYTHQPDMAQNSLIRIIYEWIVNGYVVLQYKAQIHSTLLQRLFGYLLYLAPGKKSVVDFKAAGLQVVKGGNLLEIGCGSGDSLIFLKSLGWQAKGLEIDPKSAAIASARGLDIFTQNLSKCDFANSTFDAIVINHVIEHLHDPENLLSDSLRILKVGGTIVIVTPNTKSMLHRLFKNSWMHLDPPRHLFLYTSQNLKKLAIDAGLHVKSIHTSIRDANSVYVASQSIQAKGNYPVSKNKSSLSQIKGEFVQLFEWLLIQFDKNAGEEIVITLVKR